MIRVSALLLACAICMAASAGLAAASEVDLFDEEQVDFIQMQERLSQVESVWATIVDRIDEHDRSFIQHEAEDPFGAGGFGATAGVKGGTAGVKGGTAGVKGGTAGVKGGTAGVKGGTAGVKGGEAGGDGSTAGVKGGTAGVKGGTSGVKGGTSGVKGGTSGVKGGTSGVKGGTAGNSSSVVVETTSDVHYPRFTPPLDPRDTTISQHICRSLRKLYTERYYSPNEVTQGLTRLQQLSGDSLTRATDIRDSLMCSKSADSHSVPRVAAFGDVFRQMTANKADVFEHVNKAAKTVEAKHVEHQDSCGSCWAQAAIDNFEIALAKNKQTWSPRSVQQLVDCVYPDKSGCDGGSPMDALKYLMTHGSVSADKYPYTGVVGKCRTDAGGDLYTLSSDRKQSPISWGFQLASSSAKLAADSAQNAGYVYQPCTTSGGACVKNQFAMEAELLITMKETGPYIVYVDADNWQHYDKNTLIFPPSNCRSDPQFGNHLVQLIGYTVKNNVPVWIVKNSWGPQFGDGGFIYLPVGYNACGIANYALRAAIPAPGKTPKPTPVAKMPVKITRNKIGKKIKKAVKAIGTALGFGKKTTSKAKPTVKKSLLQQNARAKAKKPVKANSRVKKAPARK